MNKVIILRGFPGAGKSNYAKELQNKKYADIFINKTSAIDADQTGYACVSADEYFINSEKEYCFDPLKIGAAHALCFRMFISQFNWNTTSVYAKLNENNHLIVVDNTNLSATEIAPYVQTAEAYNYSHEIWNIHCDPKIAFARQTHGVPADKYEMMVRQFYGQMNNFPPYWNVISKGDIL